MRTQVIKVLSLCGVSNREYREMLAKAGKTDTFEATRDADFAYRFINEQKTLEDER